MTPSLAVRASAPRSASGVPAGERRRQLRARVPQGARGDRRPRGQVGRVDARVRRDARQGEVASIQRAGAFEQLANGARELQEFGQPELPGSPGRIAFQHQLGRRGGAHAGGPDRREAVEQREFDLGRAGGSAGRGHGERVERGQPEYAEVGRGEGHRAARRGVAGAHEHAAGRAEDAARPGLERRLDPGADLRRVGRPAGGRRGRVGEHEQPVGDRRAGARRAHDLDVGRRGVAARERVDRRSRSLRVALHELVNALGDEQVRERVDGVVERAQLGVDRLALRAGERRQPGGDAPERDRRVVPARGADARAPAAAEAEPVGDVARPQRLRLRAARGRADRPAGRGRRRQRRRPSRPRRADR